MAFLVLQDDVVMVKVKKSEHYWLNPFYMSFHHSTHPFLLFHIQGTSRLAPDGCELLCCGPGFRAGRAEVVQRCSCKFSWCCSVRCQQCKNTVLIHTCREWDIPGKSSQLHQKHLISCQSALMLTWRTNELHRKHPEYSEFKVLSNVTILYNYFRLQ